MHAVSTASSLTAALALQLSLAEAFLPAALSRVASHLLGPPSGRIAATALSQASARHSQMFWLPPHDPALANAAAYLSSTFATQGASRLASPFLTAFDRQLRRPASFFAT